MGFLNSIRKSIKHWYLLLISGLILVIIGVLAFMEPADTYIALGFLFSISFLVSGISEIIFSIANRSIIDNWGWTLVLGILTAVVGVYLLQNPEISLATLPLYVGFVIMFRSFGAIGMALDLKSYGVMEWGTLMLFGVLGVLFSILLLWHPIFAGMSIVVWTGLAFISAGIYNIYLSLKLRKIHQAWEKISDEAIKTFIEAKEAIEAEMQNPSS